MEVLLTLLAPQELAGAVLIAAFAGVIKGMVGFAMPMLILSGLGSFIAADLALAGLILPTLASNLWQALRQGPKAALQSVRQFRIFLMVGLAALLTSAQLVRVLPAGLLLAGLGVVIVALAVVQLRGWVMHVAPHRKSLA